MGSDVLILTIYFLVVVYVLYQMALSVENELEDRLRIDLNVKSLTNQLNTQLSQQPYTKRIEATVEQPQFEGRKLPPRLALKVQTQNDPKQRKAVTVSVGPMGNMPIGRPISALNINIRNGTSDAQVYIDWDRSSVTGEMGKQTQRVVRTGSFMSGDLSRGQILSVVNPGEAFATQATGENCLSVNADTKTLVANKPLVNIATLARALSSIGADILEETGDPNDIPPMPAYSLRLMIGIRHITEQENYTTYVLAPFEFRAFLLPDEIAFPPLRWLLKRPRPASARNALSTLLLGRPSQR